MIRHTTIWGLVLAAATAGPLQGVRATAETTPVRVKETIEADAKGDLKIHLDVKMPAGQYTQNKINNPNLAAYLRRASLQPNWLEVHDFQGAYDDGASTVRFQWAVQGAMRATADRWEIPLFDGDDDELISTEGNAAILSRLEATPVGQAVVTTRVIVPSGAKDLRLAHSPARLTFQAPAVSDAGAANPEFTLDVKPQVMSCLAKACANPRFTDLWAARTQLTNSGGRALKDYRVHFRIKGYTANWSEWQVCGSVAPGQTVVDPFFPLFDLDKLAQLEGPEQADLEAEYEYTPVGGDTVHKSESRRLKILDRNQALASSLPAEECIDWNDQMNYMPYVLAAFVTHDDPVIQQVAGRVSGQVGGAASALSDEEAMKFLAALYEFMGADQIVYQTPPVGASEGEFFQHVKYGRDVLRNKAGTCIDLAIFYASVCDAVGLEPQMVVTRLPEGGHCFPVIRLPSGKLVVVETTMVGLKDFKAALDFGAKELSEVQAHCPYYMVPVRVLQDKGCSCMELPKLPVNVVDEWTRPSQNSAKASAPKPAPTRTADTDEGDAQTDGGKLVGVWVSDFQANGKKVHQEIRFTDDGVMISTMEDDDGRVETLRLQYTYEHGTLSLSKKGQVVEKGKIVWQNANRFEHQSDRGAVIYTRTNK